MFIPSIWTDRPEQTVDLYQMHSRLFRPVILFILHWLQEGTYQKQYSKTQGEWIHGRFSIIFYHRQLLWLTDCFTATKTLLNRVYSKGKEFAPSGSKFFPYRVDPFFRREGGGGGGGAGGVKNNFDRNVSIESVCIHFKAHCLISSSQIESRWRIWRLHLQN